MTEAEFQTKLGHYGLKWFETGAYEAKVTKTNTFPSSRYKKQAHQGRALTVVENGTFYYKIADVGYDQKPFDFFILKKEKAHLAILFEPYYYSKDPLYKKSFVLIRHKELKEYFADPKNRSISYQQASLIGEVHYL